MALELSPLWSNSIFTEYPRQPDSDTRRQCAPSLLDHLFLAASKPYGIECSAKVKSGSVLQAETQSSGSYND